MGKIIVRVVIILAVAGLVGGLIYLGVSQGAFGSLVTSGRGGEGIESFALPGGNVRGQPPAGLTGFDRNFDRGGHDQRNLLAGLGGVARSLGIVALVTAGVLLLQKGLRMFTGAWKRRQRGA